jgi:ectoine hydroxylase
MTAVIGSSRLLGPDDHERYRRDGYLLLPGLIDDGWLRMLRIAAERFIHASRELTESNGAIDLEPDHTPERPRIRRLKSPVDHDATFRRFILEGPPANLAIELLGGPVRFHHAKLNYKWSDGGSAIDWHQDVQFWPHTDFTPLTIGVYLDDVDAGMGPMEVLPGTHLGPLYDLYRPDGTWGGSIGESDLAALDLDAAVWLTGAAGSVTVHNCRTVHGSEPNRSPRMRPLLLQTYSAIDSYPIAGIGANGVLGPSGGIVVGGAASQVVEVEGCRLRGAPDWSDTGAPTIFGSQSWET